MTAIEATIPQRKRDSLYAIDIEIDALMDMLEETNNATEADHEVVQRFIEEMDGRVEDKMCGCIAWTKGQLALAAAATAEAKRLRELAAKREAKVDRLRAAIAAFFQKHEMKRVDTRLGAVRLVKNGGKDPIIIDDGQPIESMPADCIRVIKEPIKDALRKRLEAGEVIEGVRIGERGARIELG